MPILKAQSISNELSLLGSAKRSEASSWFFKTGPGQYGYGDVFYGVSVPEQRKISKRYKDLDLVEIRKLLKSKIHECRLTALFILILQYENGNETQKNTIYDFYLKNLDRVNNWDLVDSSAHKILGPHLRNRDRSILHELAESKSLWKRRVALISTFAFLKDHDFKDAINLCEIYLDDDEDLIHKATGWTLREIGKVSEPTLTQFLNKHHKAMPRTALRYSIERLDTSQRKKYMKK